MITLNLFPEGRRFAVTFSYDDGAVFDEKLVDIFNRYGIKATFNLNSARKGTEGCVKDLGIYKGHEIACHGKTHASLAYLPIQGIYEEIYTDRMVWEEVTGAPVRGLAYSNGSYNDAVIEALKTCGIVYARTASPSASFELPADFLRWHPTCHHKDAEALAEKFITKILPTPYYSGKLFSIYGHSYEFDRDGNWDMIERVCKTLAGNENIWYATNIEIFDYVSAARRLIISADQKTVYNPSVQTVWFTSDGMPIEIKGGELLKLN
jgi:peptidoglycan/xylan/chitin deacetylase (PgdA/CDA1 family)